MLANCVSSRIRAAFARTFTGPGTFLHLFLLPFHTYSIGDKRTSCLPTLGVSVISVREPFWGIPQ